MANMRKLSEVDYTLCTSIKNRTRYLEKCLKTWKHLTFKKCVIVDWSSDVDLFSEIKDLIDERFIVVRVDGRVYYDSSIAHNLGFDFVDTKWVFRIDSDVITNFHRLNEMEVEDHRFYVGGHVANARGTDGTVLLRKDHYDKANGYDERQMGYGYDDLHLYRRLEYAADASLYRFPRNSLIHIHHDDKVRGEFRHTKDITVSWEAQKKVDYKEWVTMPKTKITDYTVRRK